MAGLNVAATPAPTRVTIAPTLPEEVREADDHLEYRQGFCCGLCEVNGLHNIWPNSGKDLFIRVAMLSVFNGACIIFTDASESSGVGHYDGDDMWCEDGDVEWPEYGESLKDYIEEHKLGTVVRTGEMLNRNSDNYIHAYIWAFDLMAVKRHLNEVAPELRRYFAGARSLSTEPD